MRCAFADQAQAGVVVVNGGTHGCEPHMGFGGVEAVGHRVARGGRRGARRLLGVQYVNLVADPAQT